MRPEIDITCGQGAGSADELTRGEDKTFDGTAGAAGLDYIARAHRIGRVIGERLPQHVGPSGKMEHVVGREADDCPGRRRFIGHFAGASPRAQRGDRRRPEVKIEDDRRLGHETQQEIRADEPAATGNENTLAGELGRLNRRARDESPQHSGATSRPSSA